MKFYFSWIIVLLIATFVPGLMFSISPNVTTAFSIRNQTDSYIDIRFDLPSWNLANTGRAGSNEKKVVVEEVPYLFIEEDETLPIFTTTIAIPYSGGVNLQPLNIDTRTQSNVILEYHEAINSYMDMRGAGSSLYPQYNAVISEPAVIRELRIVHLNIYPFQ
ncbi:MAG: hypothetical protein U1C33_07315, partial [Candidatus Cloacimonadaceae bacterium]|nr:hypothetical protein [Candidatus Cloacimonadaceae bacterium]